MALWEMISKKDELYHQSSYIQSEKQNCNNANWLCHLGGAKDVNRVKDLKSLIKVYLELSNLSESDLKSDLDVIKNNMTLQLNMFLLGDKLI